MPPFSISDGLYLVILGAAAPIAAAERPRFLAELAAELERCPILGAGVVRRAAPSLARRGSWLI